MGRTRTAAIALAALATAGLAAWWLYGCDDAHRAAEDVAHDAERAAEGPPPPLAAQPHVASAATPSMDDKPIAPPERPAKPPGPMKAPMRVRVILEDPSLAAGARVQVLAHHMRGRSHPFGEPQPLGPDGTVTVDVDADGLLSSGNFPSFDVEVTHPECPTVEDELYLAEFRNREAALPLLAKGIEVHLRRACVFDGVVLDAEGAPLAGASVQALVDEDTGAEDTRTFGSGVVTGADGRFRLSIVGEGRALVAAAIRGAQPSAMPVVIHGGTTTALGTIQVRRGSSIAGRVALPGVSVAGLSVVATWVGTRKEALRPAKPGWVWVEDGRAVWSQVGATTDAEGRFRFDGLERGVYRVGVNLEKDGVGASMSLLVSAPDDRVELGARPR